VTPFLIAAGIAVLVVFDVLVMRGIATRARRRAGSALADRLGTTAVLVSATANCLGHSADLPQVRGLGVLALVHDRLVFSLAVPQRMFEVPLGSITSVEASRTFRRPGKITKMPRPTLVVGWRLVDGDAAVVGWTVRDTGAWVDLLTSSRA